MDTSTPWKRFVRTTEKTYEDSMRRIISAELGIPREWYRIHRRRKAVVSLARFLEKLFD